MKETLTTSLLISGIIFALSFAFFGGLTTSISAYSLMNITLGSLVISLPLAFLWVASANFLSPRKSSDQRPIESPAQTGKSIQYAGHQVGTGVFYARDHRFERVSPSQHEDSRLELNTFKLSTANANSPKNKAR